MDCPVIPASKMPIHAFHVKVGAGDTATENSAAFPIFIRCALCWALIEKWNHAMKKGFRRLTGNPWYYWSGRRDSNSLPLAPHAYYNPVFTKLKRYTALHYCLFTFDFMFHLV
jgi:hypothetical protein